LRDVVTPTLDLFVHSLAHDGRGIAKSDAAGISGRIVFVGGALPGDSVHARLVRVGKNFAEAETLEFRSRDRAVAPHCPHWTRCGGCPLQCMPYPEQLRWKQNLAGENLSRIGLIGRARLAEIFVSVIPSPSLRQFRNKMEFAFGADSAGTTIAGLRERRTGRILAVPECSLMAPKALRLTQRAAELAQESGLAPYGRSMRGFWRFFTVRQAYARHEEKFRWFCLCLTSPGTPKERRIVRKLAEALLGEFADMAAFVHEERKSRDSLPAGQQRVFSLNAQGGDSPGAALLRLPLGDKIFELDAASFFQVNTGASGALACRVRDFLAGTEGSSLLDAYCGVGAPGLLIAPYFKKVFGFDRDSRAAVLAQKNAERMGLTHCRYAAADAAEIFGGGNGIYETALLDPPRSGIQAKDLAALMALAPRRILYVSCNPATLARDAAALSEAYDLVRLEGLDFFPHTPGLECVSLWHRKSATNLPKPIDGDVFIW
jgi:23S rRNA (uracil1939-C5)-methyltransferase